MCVCVCPTKRSHVVFHPLLKQTRTVLRPHEPRPLGPALGGSGYSLNEGGGGGGVGEWRGEWRGGGVARRC